MVRRLLLATTLLLTAATLFASAPMGIGEQGSIVVPFYNNPGSTMPVEGVALSVVSSVPGINMLDTSFLGPVSLFPGGTVYFHVDFEIGTDYNFSNHITTITIDLTHATPNFIPASRRWVYRTQNLFKSLRGDCLEPGDIFCGEYLSPDMDPPNTEIIFDGPEFDKNDSQIFIATYTLLNFTGGDAYLEDSEISGSAVTGYKLDVPPANFEDLIPSTDPITLGEGQHILYFASRDYAGNTEVVKSTTVIVDGTAPGAALTVTADGANPSPWKNVKEFNLSWTNPSDVSGIAGVRIKFGGTQPISNDEGVFFQGQPPLTYPVPDAVNGANLIWLWLEDNVGNADPATAVPLSLRYDDITPVSNTVSPSTGSLAVVPVSFASSDEGSPATGSGVKETVLWHRNNSVAWSSGAYVLSGSSGTCNFNTQGTEGLWEFYTQAFDKAGNSEPVPVSTTPAKAATFVDVSAPVFSNIKGKAFSPDSAVIEWTTDDETTAVIDYGRTASLGSQFTETTSAKTHNISLTGLPNPADIYFRITATNKTGLITASAVNSFKTPLNISYDTDIFGVIDYSRPVTLYITNPDVGSATFVVNGQTWSGAVSTSQPVQIYVDPAVTGGGSQVISVSADGYEYSSSFVVDTATRSVKLARLVVSAGGLMSEPQPGQSAVDMTAGQEAQEEMQSAESRLYLGYYAGIDPVAPAAISGLAAGAGPEAGQIALEWTAPGDDGNAGTAMKYDLGYSSEPVTPENFSSAVLAANVPLPQIAGTKQQLILSGFSDGATYYFRLKTYDELLNFSISDSTAVKTLEVARSTTLINNQPVVQVVSAIPGITVARVSTAAFNPALVIATASAQGQGLVFFSDIYEITPSIQLSGGATVQFRYEDPGPDVEGDLAVYRYDPALPQWVMLAGVVDADNNVITALTYNFSLFAVFARDTKPPVTEIVFEGGSLYRDVFGGIYISSSAFLGFKAADPVLGGKPGSGVKETGYKMDSLVTPFIPFAGPFLPGEGFHAVQYRSVDNAGNVEQAKQLSVLVDASAPVINFKIDKATRTFEDLVIIPASSCVLTVSAFDPLIKGAASGVRYTSASLNGKEINAGEAGFAIELTSGVYRIAASAEDYVGNGAENRIDVVVGDITPPGVLISSPAAGAVFTATKDKIEIEFSVSDDFDASPRYEAYLTEVQDKGSPRGERPFRILVSSYTLMEPLDIDDGIWRLTVSATDFAQNFTTAVSGLFEVMHDTLAPRTELTIGQLGDWAIRKDVTYITARTTFTLTSIDDLITSGDGAGLGVKKQIIRLKAEGPIVKELTFENPEPRQGQTFVSTFTLAGMVDGIYGLAYNAEDIIANSEGVKISTYAVDNTAPLTGYKVAGIGYRKDDILYIARESGIYLETTDPVSNGVASGLKAVYLSVDAQPFALYNSTFTLTEGIHYLAFYGVDNVNNAENLKTLTVRVDDTPPVTSLVPATFYIPVSGRHAGDFYAPAWLAHKLAAYDPVSSDVSSGLAVSEYRVIALDNFDTEPKDPSPQDLNKPFTLFNYDIPNNSFALAEGIQRVDYRSRDNVLNLELAKTTTIFVDATPPASVLQTFPPACCSRSDGTIVNSTSPLTVYAEDPVIKGVASGPRWSYFIENGARIITRDYLNDNTVYYHAPPSYADGPLNLTVLSVDNVGNNEAPFNASVVLDNTPPAVLIISPAVTVENPGLCKLVGGTAVKVIGSVTDKGQRSEAGSQTLVEFDHFQSYTLEFGYGAAPASYTLIVSSSPGLSRESAVLGVWDTTGLPEGIYTLKLTAKDCVGNEAFTKAQVIISQPKLLLSLGSRGNGHGEFNSPSYIAVDPADGSFWVSDTNNDRLQKFTSSGTWLMEIAAWGGAGKGHKPADSFNKPQGLAVDSAGNLWAVDGNNDRALKFSATGQFLLELKAGFNKPHGLALDAQDNLYIADRNNDRILKFSPEGQQLLTINTGLGADLNKPVGVLAVDRLGSLYVSDRNNDRVLVYDPSGSFIRQLGEGSGSGPGQFNKPDGIALNALAYAFVADTNNSRVQKFDPYGNLVMVFDRASNDAESFNHPGGLAVDAEGNLFVVDSNNARVRKFGAEGELVRIASQDDGEKAGARAAKLVAKAAGGKVHHPNGVTLDIPAGALVGDAEIAITAGHKTGGSGYRTQGAGAGKKLASITENVEFGPDGTVFNKPVTISIPYNPGLLAAGVSETELAVFWWNPARQVWEEIPSSVDTRLKVVTAQTTHFSLYTVMAPVVSGIEFALGEVYVFPNPAKRAEVPTFHIEAGIADKVTIKIYTVSGRLAHETALSGLPQIIDDGRGSEYAYEYAWDGHIPSGVYYYLVEAEKAGKKLKKTGKFAVIR